MVAKLDSLQQSTALTAITVAVLKRYGDDKASRLAALVTFYGFLSVFPLLLLTITFAALVVGEPTLRKDLVDSAVAQFPVIGDQLESNIHAIVVGNSIAVIAALIGLLWGCFGITNSLQSASAAVWRRPATEDPSILGLTRKGVAILGILAAVAVLSTVVAGAAANGVARFGVGGADGRALALALVLAVNAAGYFAALRLLAPAGTAWRTVAPGAAMGAAGWTVMQVLGGWLIGHRLSHASQLYGAFAVVLGLIFWINIGAQMFLYATELNLVVARREWPRSIRAGAV